MKTGIITTNSFVNHDTGLGHPERADRVSVIIENLKKFEKKYFNTYNKKSNEVSILGYDALGLIYYCWYKNNFHFSKDQLYSKKGFKGLHGEFVIIDNKSIQKLNIYKVSKSKFIKVY